MRGAVGRVDVAPAMSYSWHLARKQTEQSIRHAERRRREDEAPRLQSMFPRLQSLKLEIRERRAGAPVAEAGYVRRIMVDQAPALFLLHCGDPSCKNSEHDVTYGVLQHLRAGDSRFEGHDACNGQIGSAQCQRELEYVAFATYAP